MTESRTIRIGPEGTTEEVTGLAARSSGGSQE